MRQAGLKPVWKRKFVHATDSKHNLPIADNILARHFNPGAPNVADITYVRGHAEKKPKITHKPATYIGVAIPTILAIGSKS